LFVLLAEQEPQLQLTVVAASASLPQAQRRLAIMLPVATLSISSPRRMSARHILGRYELLPNLLATDVSANAPSSNMMEPLFFLK